MAERSWAAIGMGPPPARWLSGRHLKIAAAYLVGYAALDWLSYVHPFAWFGITPWNPPTGLSFALVLLFGREFVPWLFVAPMLADAVVRGLPLPIGIELAATAIIGAGYGAATSLLVSPRVAFDPSLATRQSLLLLLTAAVSSTVLVTAAYVGLLVIAGILSLADSGAAALRFWVGEVIGVTVLTPFLLMLATRRWALRPSWEAFGLIVFVAGALWAVFGLADTFRFQVFYLFFLPITWTAVRFGLEGVCSLLVITQVGLVGAMHFAEQDAANVTAYQALMFVLAITGLAIGVLVSEQQRTQRQLRLNQEALDRALRLRTMGEFSAALAHEINQPLTAAANYARLAHTAADLASATQASKRVISQIERAAEVIRRLRDLIRLGRSETSVALVPELIEEALAFCHTELERHGVDVQVRLDGTLPAVSVDVVQIEQVIINLVRNAAEALSEAGRQDGRVIVEAELGSESMIVVGVRDNGPGFDPGVLERASAPFITTKEEGLGLGLSLARSIIEAHGGRLSISSTPHGAVVQFTLRAATSAQREVAS